VTESAATVSALARYRKALAESAIFVVFFFSFVKKKTPESLPLGVKRMTYRAPLSFLRQYALMNPV